MELANLKALQQFSLAPIDLRTQFIDALVQQLIEFGRRTFQDSEAKTDPFSQFPLELRHRRLA